MNPVCLLNVVGLTPRHIGEHTPNLARLAKQGFMTSMQGVIPAVTCTAQATMLTGLAPKQHGIVGNGWYFRELGETRFWVQANALLQGEKIYETAKQLSHNHGEKFTCAKLFWWYNQGADVDWSLTPKPHYGADGSKEFAIYSQPTELAEQLTQSLGKFPFHHFWGPTAGLAASKWIAQAAAQIIEQKSPTLSLVYLPHLDYALQRQNPRAQSIEQGLAQVDACVGMVARAAEQNHASILVVSEYGLMPVKRAIALNRLLRAQGWLAVREGPYGEMLDTFASKAFAVVDHQIAHVYVNDPTLIAPITKYLRKVAGIAQVYALAERQQIDLDHSHSGEIIALAAADSWFAYYYWLDDQHAPDFARTVDIHRKPGYDPCELFFDKKLWFPRARATYRILQKKLGLRYLMDVIPLQPELVQGSHGIAPPDPLDGPIYLSNVRIDAAEHIDMRQVKQRVLNLLTNVKTKK